MTSMSAFGGATARAWSKEAPTEPGLYWIRWRCGMGGEPLPPSIAQWWQNLDRVESPGSFIQVASSSVEVALWGPRIPSAERLAALWACADLLNEIEECFNPAGLEVDMPQRLGGENLLLALCKADEALKRLDAAAE